MKRSHNNYGILAILTLAVALPFVIANIPCYGNVEIHYSSTPYGSRGSSGDGYYGFSWWTGSNSHAQGDAWDGPTWSSAWGGSYSDWAAKQGWTTGGTGSEELEWSYLLWYHTEIAGNARNDDPYTQGYGWAYASAEAYGLLSSYDPDYDWDDYIGGTLYDEATEPGIVDDEDEEESSHSGTCFADAYILVYHHCSASAAIETDAWWMKGRSDVEVQAELKVK
jgi:hypothetical protein